MRSLQPALLMVSLEALGRRAEAERYAPLLEDFSPDSQNRNRRWAAAVAASRGDVEESVRLLREAFSADMRYYSVNETFMHTRPEFEPIREHPLFVQLMRPTN